MKEANILRAFDGRGRVVFLLGGFEGGSMGKIEAIGFELGYDHEATEVPSRGTIRMIFIRNDAPNVRRRAQETLNRIHAGGPLLPPQTFVPGTQPGSLVPVAPIQAAQARRGIAAYETHGSKGLVVFIALLGFGFLLLAWVRRDTLDAALVLAALAVALAVAAAVTPRWMRRWHDRNQRLVRRFDQARNHQVGLPPAPPPPPPLR